MAGRTRSTSRTDPAPPQPAAGPGENHAWAGDHGSAAPDDEADVPIPPTAAELVARIREGDHSAWAELNDRYIGLMWSIARGEQLDQADAEEAVQTAWLRLIENIERLRDPEHVGSWLATTVRRECQAIRRYRGRVRPGLDAEPVDEPAATSAEPEEVLLVAERDAALWRAFETLPARDQQLLRLLLAEPTPTYAEVAAALGRPIGYIGPTRRRSLDHLRALLTADEPAPEGPLPIKKSRHG